MGYYLMKNNMLFKNRKAEKQRLKNQWNYNLEIMFKCIEEICGKDKSAEVAALMRKRVKII